MSSTQVRPDPRPTDRRFVGRWRIVEMEEWDADFIDLEVPGHFTFAGDQGGEFQFGMVRGWVDCRYEGEKARVDFSWEGADDADEACGRGWAEISGDLLRGRIFIHRGDDSAFEARKEEPEAVTTPRPRRRSGRAR